MFKIEQINNSNKKLNHILIKDLKNNSYAKIYVNMGGSLQELFLKKHKIIGGLSIFDYPTTFASAILFPFTNRIKNGVYTFNHSRYELELNHTNQTNAIHGLVYNKSYKIVDQYVTADSAFIILKYRELNKPKGFPFDFTITLTYQLTKNSLSLLATIKNKDSMAFPFSIGWHPYFCSNNLHDSSLTFKSNKKLIFDENMIPIKIKSQSINLKSFQIKDNKFDNCYILKENNIIYKTPKYALNFEFSPKKNFIQIYTHKQSNNIAIEPMTAPSNSFNNGLGLKVLKPNEIFRIKWKINLIKDE